MLESCFCGRTGEIEGREFVVDDEGSQALRCPDCGHLEYLVWLPEDARDRMFEKAAARATLSGASTAA